MAQNINRSQVFNAADAISATGQNPTVAGVRAKLGSGSFTTITAMLREWKSQADTKAPDDESDIPEEVTEALARSASIVWKAAQDHFKHELATMKKDTAHQVETAQQQTADALAEIESLEALLDVSSKNTIDLANANDEAINTINTMRQECAEQTATIKALEARIKAQDDLLRRLVPEPKKTPATQNKTTPATKKSIIESIVADQKKHKKPEPFQLEKSAPV